MFPNENSGCFSPINSNLFQLKNTGSAGFFYRDSVQSNTKSLFYINADEPLVPSVVRGYSTMVYNVPAGFDFNCPAKLDNQGNPKLNKDGEVVLKTLAQHLQENCELLPQLVCDIDCEKVSKDVPDLEDLDKLTRTIPRFVSLMLSAGLVMYKHFIIMFSGNKGYRFAVPHTAFLDSPFPPSVDINPINNIMSAFAYRLIKKYSSPEDSDYLLSRLDKMSFTKERIMRVAHSFHREAGTYSFVLTPEDLSAMLNGGFEYVKNRAKTFEPLFDCSLLSLEKSEELSAMFIESKVIPVDSPREVSRIVSEGKKKVGRPPKVGFKCGLACVEYFVNNADKLVSDSSNRFDINLPFLTAVYSQDDSEEAVNRFHLAVANKIHPSEDNAERAEKWTKENFGSLAKYKHICNGYKDKNGVDYRGTYTFLKSLINHSECEVPDFKNCNSDCPFYDTNTAVKITQERANRWAVNFVEENHIIFDGSAFYMYNGGFYEKKEEFFIRQKIDTFWGDQATCRRQADTLNKIKTIAFKSAKEITVSENEICLLNGILNLKDFTFTPEHTPDKFFFHRVNAEYFPGVSTSSPIVDKLLDGCFPEEDHKPSLEALMRFIGYSFTSDTSLCGAAYCYSEGESGKTQVDETLTHLQGGSSLSCNSIDQMDDKFFKGRLKNKNLLVVSDLGKNERLDGILKQIISGDKQSYDVKNVTGDFEYKPIAKVFINANHPFDTRTLEHNFTRRFVPITFPQNFGDACNKSKKIPGIAKKIIEDQSALNHFFFLAIEALKRLRADNGQFYTTDEAKRAALISQVGHNPVFRFASSYLRYQKGKQMKRSDLYKCFNKFVREEGIKNFPPQETFFRELSAVVRKVSSVDLKSKDHHKKINGIDYLVNITVVGMDVINDWATFVEVKDDTRHYPSLNPFECDYNEYLRRANNLKLSEETPSKNVGGIKPMKPQTKKISSVDKAAVIKSIDSLMVWSEEFRLKVYAQADYHLGLEFDFERSPEKFPAKLKEYINSLSDDNKILPVIKSIFDLEPIPIEAIA